MGIIDLVVIGVVVLSIIFALYRGLVRELLGITAWVLAALVGLYSYAYVHPIMGKVIENEAIAGLVGATIIALAVLVVMTILNAHVASRLRESSLSGLDRILGFAFGIFRAWLLIAIVYIGASMVLSDKQLEQADKDNITMPYVHLSAEWLQSILPENIQSDIKSYEQGKLKAPDLKKIGKDVQELKEKAAGYKEETRESLDQLIEEADEEFDYAI